MGAVQVAGATVAFDDTGAGDPLVLVHSTGGSRLQWLLITPGLAERHRVLMPEMSGAGETTDDGEPLTVDGLVNQVLAVADAAGVERFHLAGYSLGAAVAVAVAAKAGERVRSLLPLFGWSRSDPSLAFQFRLWSDLFRADRRLFAHYLVSVGSSSGIIETLREGIEGIVDAIAAGLAPGTDRHADLDAVLDISDRLGRVSAPTLVVGGAGDRILPIEHSRQLADGIPGARLLELEGNHLFYMEQPGRIVELILDWAGRH